MVKTSRNEVCWLSSRTHWILIPTEVSLDQTVGSTPVLFVKIPVIVHVPSTTPPIKPRSSHSLSSLYQYLVLLFPKLIIPSICVSKSIFRHYMRPALSKILMCSLNETDSSLSVLVLPKSKHYLYMCPALSKPPGLQIYEYVGCLWSTYSNRQDEGAMCVSRSRAGWLMGPTFQK
jgi:hypothetical protein